MPIGGGPSNGPFPSVAQLPTVWGQVGNRALVFAGAGTLTTPELKADNLPGLNAWFLQTAGAGVVTVQLQFQNGVSVVPSTPDWQPLIAAYNLTLNVPNLVNPRLGTPKYRASVTSTGAATVLFRLTASLS